MPLPIDVKPYVLNGVVGGDNYLTHYKASNPDGEEFIISEFYPAYMVKREDDGTLGISERFSKEFISDREEFVRRAEAFREMRDVSLHPVVEIFEKNHTAYIVRRACGLTTVDQYMGSQTMDYDEAYFFIRPLILSLAQVSEHGMAFNISQTDFRVNSFKQLVLCAPPSWDSNFHAPLIRLMRLYYRLITGAEPPEQGAHGFSAYGIDVPPRIESLVLEILSGDILYGSLDDFYKKFKSLIDGITDTNKDSGKKTLARMRGVVAVLFVLFVISLGALVFGAVQAYRVTSFWASPDVFADSEPAPPPAYDFSEITLTHPRNPADVLIGSFAVYDGFIFFRGENGMKSRFFADIIFVPGAMGMSALADDRLIIPDAVPAHIVGHGNNIYFVDTAAGGVIYRATTIGSEITRITEFPALNLAVIGDYLFYSDVGRGHHLYRRNLETNRTELIYESPVRATLAHGSYLFFVAEHEGTTALYSWNLNDGPVAVRIATDAAGGLRVCDNRVFGNALFYIDTAGRIRSITFDGRPIATHSPENVRSFDVFFQWLIFTEEGTHVPRAYNMDNGNFFTLSTTEWASYVWVHDELIYAIDHRNPTLIHNFYFPMS